MLEGLFVTVSGFKELRPFPIGGRLVCCKEPRNPFDDEAIVVLTSKGDRVGYLANAVSARANGTMSCSRVYDRVGDRFEVEVCFTTRTKVICKIVNYNLDTEEGGKQHEAGNI